MPQFHGGLLLELESTVCVLVRFSDCSFSTIFSSLLLRLESQSLSGKFIVSDSRRMLLLSFWVFSKETSSESIFLPSLFFLFFFIGAEKLCKGFNL